MNILYLTMSRLTGISKKGIYQDLMRKLRDEGHNVYIVSPLERQFHLPTRLTEIDGVHILGVRTLNVQKTNVIEKGLGQLLLEPLYKRAIGKYYCGIKFDLILYSTPPITFVNVIRYVRRINPEARTYLMLKDIFPQNAVDLGMLSKNGIRGFLYRKFRRKEKALYRISDWIGCMSPANVKYLIEHNPEVNPAKVEMAPNAYSADSVQSAESKDLEILRKYGLPSDKPIFIYGGNLGKPQGIPFLIDCLKANSDRKDCHFVVVGDGVDYPKIEKWFNSASCKSVSLFKHLPVDEYNKLAASCDIGLIFLDYRFTIPNYPSRLLSYLMGRKPIIACTDPNCDTGTIAEKNGYGFWCPSNSVEAFTMAVDRMLASDIRQMGENGYRFFLQNYTVQNTYNAIMKHMK